MPSNKTFKTDAELFAFLKSQGKDSIYGNLLLEKFDTSKFKTFFKGLVEGKNLPNLKLEYEGDKAAFFPTKLILGYSSDKGVETFSLLEGVKAVKKITPHLDFPKVAATTKFVKAAVTSTAPSKVTIGKGRTPPKTSSSTSK